MKTTDMDYTPIQLKLPKVFQEANETVLQYLGLKLGIREEYSVEYLAEMQTEFLKVTGMTQEQFVHGSGKRKTPVQRLYERMDDSRKKLKGYREKVEICGENLKKVLHLLDNLLCRRSD